MRLVKIGRVLPPERFAPWMVSHAAYPTPFRVNDRTIRVFFVSRDVDARGRVGWCDVSASDPTKILQISKSPILGPGEAGAFDDSGVAIGNFVAGKDGLYLYYMGWNRSVSVPFRNAIGVAVSRDGRGEHFERLFPGPLIDRNPHDPYSLSYPFVFRAGDTWEMLYGSHRGDTYSPMHHVMCRAVSDDGILWKTDDARALDLIDGESAVCRPWIFEGADGRHYQLFSSDRGRYEIGFAVRDGTVSWRRIPIDTESLGKESWENEELCYAAHIEVQGRHLVFYNGNEYGGTGFGVCELLL